MLAGELYDPTDPHLAQLRTRARLLTGRLNASTEDQPDLRREICIELFAAGGDTLSIEPPFYCDYGCHIHLGEKVFINFGCVMLDPAEIRIGDGTLLGPAVQVYTATHPLDPDQRPAGLEQAQRIEVGRNCWIGGGAILCPGVTVGEGTTIGAGSVVTRDLPSRVVAAGNPCRVIRRL